MTAVGKGWTRRLSPLTIEVECRGSRHRIRWVRGSIVAVDHDLTAERALVALGGAPCPCVQFVDVATGAGDDLQILLTWNEELAPGKASGLRSAGAAAGAILSALAKAAPAFSGVLGRQAMLADLSPQALERIALGKVVALARRPAADEMQELDLEFALSLRAKPAFLACVHAWTRRSPDRLPGINCVLGPPGEDAYVGGSIAEGYVLSLPARWLPEVWAPGLALVDDCFVLAVDRVRGAVVDGLAVRWERVWAGEEAPVVRRARMQRSAERWHLRWA